LARGYQLTGFVQNLPDGKVLLVAEGDVAEIDGFLASIHAEMGSHIDKTQILRSDYQGSFREFDIKY
jgi:acylphosphatase